MTYIRSNFAAMYEGSGALRAGQAAHADESAQAVQAGESSVSYWADDGNVNGALQGLVQWKVKAALAQETMGREAGAVDTSTGIYESGLAAVRSQLASLY